MPTGQGSHHHVNVRGRDSIISKDIELRDFILMEYMAGKTTTQISKDILIQFPEKTPVSRVTIARFVNSHLDDLDVEEKGINASTELLDAFNEVKNNFNTLFDKVRSLDLTPDQVTMVDQMQRKCNISLNKIKLKWKLFLIQTKQSNSELKDLLLDFCMTLSSQDKEKLSLMVDEMFEPKEVLTEQDQKKYRKYQLKRNQMYYKMFPQDDREMEVQ